MIKVTIGNSLGRTEYMLTPNTTIRQALEQAEIDYTRGGVSLDGCPLQSNDLDKTFADKGITEKCFLLQVVKADNA